ncbi:MAG: bifunctional phosphoribosylaminoimidazolecarboxamide formyltransferase/IMP cyclohydrolase [Proteobacteria bacterium]|nr:bifunctional phosphoribosylaminoimidazolecarboxamide formyltransferase/IMP cyclohydrolase [Pseudomonadota bacterium]
MAEDALIAISRALISVSDKTGVEELGRFLAARGVEILSTGGTAKALRGAGVEVKDVSRHTGFPEMMDGRVKTLHPHIHGAILARRDNASDQEALDALGIGAIDLVAVNLYPFAQTVAKGAGAAEAIANIDIGGPTLIRAAAKNFAAVTVITDPADYAAVIKEMEANGGATTLGLRHRLAAAAFARTAHYDAAIDGWFARRSDAAFPDRMALGGELKEILRYGENPHQRAALYLDPADRSPGPARAEQSQGKALSFNNLADADAAFALVAELARPAIAIIKHANPCGAATGNDLHQAYVRALASDPESAFGGIVAANQTIDAKTAEEIAKIFVEVVIAPAFDDDARRVLAAKKNLRVLTTGTIDDTAQAGMTVRSVAGGYLLQSPDTGAVQAGELKTVTRKKPDDDEMRDLLFAFTVAKHVKSNAIVFAKGGATVGIGAGQMSRIDSTRMAVIKAAAGEGMSRAKGAVAASDAFYPFPDALLAAAEAGIVAVIQPGGSIRDADVIKAADDAGIAMVFTGMRHFRH